MKEDRQGRLPADMLKLENQLCFPLYACSREVVKAYFPLLSRLDLTYTQYLVMMVLWEQSAISVKELGQKLYLDSGTLTPLLKKLEAKELLTRTRSAEDERVVLVNITEKGTALYQQALSVPQEMSCKISLSTDEVKTLYNLLYKLIGDFNKDSE